MAETIAVVRPPTPDLSRCELTHRARVAIDFERASEQHARYCELLAELGCRLHPLAPLDGFPDACFVEDPCLVLDELCLAAPMAAKSRRGELASLLAAIGEYRAIERLPAPCHLDGGDVLAIDGMLYVGQSTRTNHAALKTLAHRVFPLGLRVKAVEVFGALHLKTVCTALDGERLLVHRPRLNPERIRDLQLVEVPSEEAGGASVLRVGDTLVLSSSFPRTAEMLSRLGYDLRTTDLTEFEKAEGGPTCLVQLFERTPLT